jgi:hypothetical protein
MEANEGGNDRKLPEPASDRMASNHLVIECSRFECTSIDNGKIRLSIKDVDQVSREPSLDPNGTRVLYTGDVATLLGKSRKTIYKMGKRKKNRIPFIRGRGRPYILERQLYAYLADSDREFKHIQKVWGF